MSLLIQKQIRKKFRPHLARINARDTSVERFYEYGIRAVFWTILHIVTHYQLPLTALATGYTLAESARLPLVLTPHMSAWSQIAD